MSVTTPQPAANPASSVIDRLSPDDVARFDRDGYLVIREPVLPKSEFEALKSHFEAKLAAWEAAGRSPEHMDVPHFEDPELFRWLFADSILGLIQPLIGPNIALWSSHFICKPAGKGKRVPWHEDSAYWKGRLEPMEVLTIWLAIDPSRQENGCMRVIPGTHKNGFSDYEAVNDPDKQVFNREIKATSFDESAAVDLELEPNQCSIHHAKLIHGSNPNRGTLRRCGYTMRYMPTTVAFQSGGYNDGFQIYLARGQDLAGNSYGDPTRPNEGWKKR